MNSFGKDLISVLKSKVTVIVAGIITSIITARYLGPEGNGVLATLTVYPSIFMVIGALGIRQSTAYFVGQNRFSNADIFSAVLQIWIFTSITCMLICYILLKFTTKEDYSNNLIFLAISPIPFSLITTYGSGFFLGMNKIKEFNTVNWVPFIVKLFAAVLLIIIIPWGVHGALVGITIGYILLTLLIWGKLKALVEMKWNFDWRIIKSMINLGIVYAISLLIISLNYKIDVMLLEKLSNEYEVGIYTKGVSIVEHLWDIPTLLGTIIFARSASASNSKLFSLKVAQLLRICFPVILISSLLFFFISDFLMVTMYGEEFQGSAMVQKLLLPGILLMTIFKVLNMDMAGRGKPWLSMFAMLPALIINIILNYLWNTEYGANGAALASTISYSISAIIFLFVYSSAVKIPIKSILKFTISDYDFIFRHFKNK